MKEYIKKHWIKILIITLIFTVSMGRFQYKMPKRQFADFHVNYYAGERMLSGLSVYDQEAFRKDKVAVFKYPPLFASITALFALTSERVAATAWFTLNYILIILFIYFSGKMIFDDKLSLKQKDWIYFWALFLTTRFYLQNFDEGQVNFLMMTTILLGLYAAQRNRALLSGFLFGFSILVKYMGAIFIPYLLIKRKFKVVVFIVISLLIYSVMPALFWGWERNLSMQREFFPYLCKTSLDMYSLSDYANQSLMAMLVRFFSSYGGYGINLISLNDYQLGFLTGCSYILVYLLAFLHVKGSNHEMKTRDFYLPDLALLFVCAAFFNPNAWIHAFIFLTFGYMVIFDYLFRNSFKDKIVLFLTVFSFILHSFTASFFTQSWDRHFFEIWSFVGFGVIIVLLALFKIKLRGIT